MVIAEPRPSVVGRLILPALVAAAIVAGGTGGYLVRGATTSSSSQPQQISRVVGSSSSDANSMSPVEWCGPVGVCVIP